MGRISFGLDEKITCIVDVALKGADDEDLCLAYKISRRDVVAPIYLTDDGYVLRPRDHDGLYYPMPEGEELAALQQDGLLPSPLPAYEIPLFERVSGFSLWIILGGIILYEGGKRMFRRAPAAPGTIPPAAGDAGPYTGPGPIG